MARRTVIGVVLQSLLEHGVRVGHRIPPRARRVLPALAIALSTLGVIVAAALAHGLMRLGAVDPGFRTADVQARQLGTNVANFAAANYFQPVGNH